jgi:hypothetical protein
MESEWWQELVDRLTLTSKAPGLSLSSKP